MSLLAFTGPKLLEIPVNSIASDTMPPMLPTMLCGASLSRQNRESSMKRTTCHFPWNGKLALSIAVFARHVSDRGEETSTEFNLEELQTGKTAQERLEDLEIAIAHQSKTIEELNAVVAVHSETITELQRRIDALNRRAAVTEMQISDISPIDKPPHW